MTWHTLKVWWVWKPRQCSAILLTQNGINYQDRMVNSTQFYWISWKSAHSKYKTILGNALVMVRPTLVCINMYIPLAHWASSIFLCPWICAMVSLYLTRVLPQLIQNSALRSLPQANKHTSVKLLHDKLKIFNFEQRHYVNMVVNCYNHDTNPDRSYMSQKVERTQLSEDQMDCLFVFLMWNVILIVWPIPVMALWAGTR